MLLACRQRGLSREDFVRRDSIVMVDGVAAGRRRSRDRSGGTLPNGSRSRCQSASSLRPAHCSASGVRGCFATRR